MKKQSLASVWSQANVIIRDIESWVEYDSGRHIRLQYKPIDQARLLKLRLWSMRYHVPVYEILDMMVPILRNQTRRQKSKYGLGVSVRGLTSYGTEKILAEKVLRRYPNDENHMTWRQNEIERHLAHEESEELGGLTPRTINIANYDSADAYITAYRKSIENSRAAYTKAVNESWRKRKPYRGNPYR